MLHWLLIVELNKVQFIYVAKASAWLIFKGLSNWCLHCSELRRFISNSFKNLKFTSGNTSIRLSLGPSDVLFIYFCHSDRTENESWKKGVTRTPAYIHGWLVSECKYNEMKKITVVNSPHKSYSIEHNLTNATCAIALKHKSQNSEGTF